MSDVIMAVDFGRFKCVVRLDRRATRAAAFRSIDTDAAAFLDL